MYGFLQCYVRVCGWMQICTCLLALVVSEIPSEALRQRAAY